MTLATAARSVYASCVAGVTECNDTGGSGAGFEWGFLVILGAMLFVAVMVGWRSRRR